MSLLKFGLAIKLLELFCQRQLHSWRFKPRFLCIHLEKLWSFSHIQTGPVTVPWVAKRGVNDSSNYEFLTFLWWRTVRPGHVSSSYSHSRYMQICSTLQKDDCEDVSPQWWHGLQSLERVRLCVGFIFNPQMSMLLIFFINQRPKWTPAETMWCNLTETVRSLTAAWRHKTNSLFLSSRLFTLSSGHSIISLRLDFSHHHTLKLYLIKWLMSVHSQSSLSHLLAHWLPSVEPDVALLAHISAHKHCSDAVYSKDYYTTKQLFASQKPNKDDDATSCRKQCLSLSFKSRCCVPLSYMTNQAPY